jgi:hypothetical protein
LREDSAHLCHSLFSQTATPEKFDKRFASNHRLSCSCRERRGSPEFKKM